MSLIPNLIPSFARTPAQTDATAASALEPTVKPIYEIKETADAYAVTVLLPGVTKDALEITADDSQVRILGRRGWQRRGRG